MKKIILFITLLLSFFSINNTFADTLILDNFGSSYIHRLKDWTNYLLPATINCSDINSVTNYVAKLWSWTWWIYEWRVAPSYTYQNWYSNCQTNLIWNIWASNMYDYFIFNDYNNNNTLYLYAAITSAWTWDFRFLVWYYINNNNWKYSIVYLSDTSISWYTWFKNLKFVSVYDSSSWWYKPVFFQDWKKFFSWWTNFDLNYWVGFNISENVENFNWKIWLLSANYELNVELEQYIYWYNNTILTCSKNSNTYNMYVWSNDWVSSNHQSLTIPPYKWTSNFWINCSINYDSLNNVTSFSSWNWWVTWFTKVYNPWTWWHDLASWLYALEISNSQIKWFNLNNLNITNLWYSPIFNNSTFPIQKPFISSNQDENLQWWYFYKNITNNYIYSSLDLVENPINTPTLSWNTITTVEQNSVNLTLNPNINNQINISMTGWTSWWWLTDEDKWFWTDMFGWFWELKDWLWQSIWWLWDKIENLFGSWWESFSWTNITDTLTWTTDWLWFDELWDNIWDWLWNYSWWVSQSWSWTFNSVIVENATRKTCKMFNTDGSFAYNSNRNFQFTLKLDDTWISLLDKILFIPQKFIDFLTNPINNTISIFSTFWTFPDNSQVCFIWIIQTVHYQKYMSYDTSWVIPQLQDYTISKWEMTFIDYMVLLWFWIILLFIWIVILKPNS